MASPRSGSAYLFARALLENPRVSEHSARSVIFDATIRSATDTNVLCSLRCLMTDPDKDVRAGVYDIYAKVSATCIPMLYRADLA